MIEMHHWPANSTELIEAGQWLQLIYIASQIILSVMQLLIYLLSSLY